MFNEANVPVGARVEYSEPCGDGCCHFIATYLGKDSNFPLFVGFEFMPDHTYHMGKAKRFHGEYEFIVAFEQPSLSWQVRNILMEAGCV